VVIKSTITFISTPDGKIHNQTDHISIDRRWNSSILAVRSFRRADCNNDHYLVNAKVRKRLAVSKQVAQKFNREIFNLRKLNEMEVRKPYQTEITNRLPALENLRDGKDINRAWGTLKAIS
jgi:hypothetical protein